MNVKRWRLEKYFLFAY